MPIYVVLMLIAICLRKLSLNTSISPDSNDLFGMLMSLACSAHEERKVKYTFRPLSKIAFAFIFLPCLGYLMYKAEVLTPNTDEETEFNLRNITICSDICNSTVESLGERIMLLIYILFGLINI